MAPGRNVPAAADVDDGPVYALIDTMILTRDVILREIEAGRVVIEPFFADQVGPASIDLHLGDEIRVMHARREIGRAHV